MLVSNRRELYFYGGGIKLMVRPGVSHCDTRAMHADGCSRDLPDLECNKHRITFMDFAIRTDSKVLCPCTNPVSRLTKRVLVRFFATSDLKLNVIRFR